MAREKCIQCIPTMINDSSSRQNKTTLSTMAAARRRSMDRTRRYLPTSSDSPSTTTAWSRNTSQLVGEKRA